MALPMPMMPREFSRAGAAAVLLMAAKDQRAVGRALLDVEGADALGAVDLVCGHGQEVHVQVAHVDGDLAYGLDSVGVEEGPGLVSDARGLADVLDGADLVVGHHHGHHADLVGHGPAQVVEVDAPELVHGQVVHAVFSAAQAAGGVEHAGVFDGRGHEVVAPAERTGAGGAVAVQQGQDSVVGLGAAADEEDFLGFGADEAPDLFAGIFYFFPGLAAEGMHAGRVAEYFKPLDQGLLDLRVQGRRGVVVEVDCAVFH
jgi:hypothetical protein